MRETTSGQLPAGPIAVASIRLEEHDGELFAQLVTNDDVRHRSEDAVRYFSNASDLFAAVKVFTERFVAQPKT